MKKALKFKCPKCSKDLLEEIMINVIVSTPICRINQIGDNYEPEYDYSKAENFDGQVDRYQCAKCGFIVPVRSLDDLAATEYMQEQK